MIEKSLESREGETPRNLVLILSDEHNRDCLGCYGHKIVKTPNLDALAERGTRFTNAYCNSPICVPSRAALATGRYVHQTGHWDNAHPYDGTPESWHHMVDRAGMTSTSIGKLHFRAEGRNGFTEEIVPLHVVDGLGDLKGLLRAPLPDKKGADAMALDAGAATSEYYLYDCTITERAVDWLETRDAEDGPFVLFVSLVMPHFPLQVPAEYFAPYHALGLEALNVGAKVDLHDHPALAALRAYMNYEDYFDDDARQRALAAYFGMVTAIDNMVGQIVAAVSARADADRTVIAYSSDHGENLGNRGLWGKSVMYEDSLAVPMILAGPGVPEGQVCKTPVSLIDIAPTVRDLTGLPRDENLHGTSLHVISRELDDPDRPVFAEYHAAGSPTGMFMYREGRWKLVEYAGMESQLFDLASDPGETLNLATDADHAETLARLRAGLAEICDIDEVNARAFADQAALVEAQGGRDAVLSGSDIPHTPAPV